MIRAGLHAANVITRLCWLLQRARCGLALAVGREPAQYVVVKDGLFQAAFARAKPGSDVRIFGLRAARQRATEIGPGAEIYRVATWLERVANG